MVVRAELSRPLDSKIRIATDRGNFAVVPTARLAGRSIEPIAADFVFERDGGDVGVYITDNGHRSFLGALDLSSVKAFRGLGIDQPTKALVQFRGDFTVAVSRSTSRS